MASTLENETSKHMINESDQIILMKGKKISIFKIKKDRQVWLEKNKFTLNGCIGHPYGTTFEVRGGGMVKVDKSPTEASLDAGTSTGKDNRDLQDLDTNQKLTKEDIETMKKKGLEGKEIIDQLIENSATFQSKTEYAQAKWIKKKKQKHVLEFTVLKPCTRLLCAMYHAKNPSKICFMRMDTVAQILTQGNVRAHSTVAVVDTCMGLVVGAVMERLGGFGKVIHFYSGSSPVRPALDNFDFPPHFLDCLYSYPLDQVNCIKTKKIPTNTITASVDDHTNCVKDTKTEQVDDSDQVDGSSNEKKDSNSNSKTTKSSDSVDDNDLSTEKSVDSCDSKGDVQSESSVTEESSQQGTICGDSEKMDTSEADVQTDEKRIAEKRKQKEICRETNRQVQQQKLQEIRDCLLQCDVDCLIVACKFHPTPIVMALIEYIAPSRPVVVFGQYKEPVMDCYVYLRERGGLVNFRVTETWLRDYQVMDMRTHPVINMSGGGGYLLSATTIAK